MPRSTRYVGTVELKEDEDPDSVHSAFQRSRRRLERDMELAYEDALAKNKGKNYRDQQQGVKQSEIPVCDSVMMQNTDKGSKWSVNFGPDLCKVVQKTGADTIVSTGSGKIRARYSAATSRP